MYVRFRFRRPRGPNDNARQRHFALATYQETPAGWRTEELPGAANQKDWEAAWAWATRLWVAGNSVHPGAAGRYAKAFLKRVKLYPSYCWWIWGEAEPNPRWDGNNAGVGAEDEYQYTLTAPEAGTYDTAFRFSVDGGQTWTYCDGDGPGNTNGYQVEAAGHMLVNAQP